MRAEPTGIDGSWVIHPTLHPDDRGVFLESFTQSNLRQITGREMPVAQQNISVSKLGTIRGIHYALNPPGQAKFVTCVAGRALDVVVDLRLGSQTFAQYRAVEISAADHTCVFISEGLGHAFMALTDEVTMCYLTSTPFDPAQEFGVNVYDTQISIEWPTHTPHLISPKDEIAPSLQQMSDKGLLPYS
jgi:dTDP-4-dehydrorhamnose 3,5-epimerase